MIEIGAQVVANEKIQTSASGSVQVLFIDKTTLNVGPNSTLVIDRFVYNPATTKGELALSLSKGVIRVVGGIATHSEGATIRTPVAAIGLRGGIAIISHSSTKGTQAILGFGRMSVTSLCGGSDCHPTTTDVTRPGYGVRVGFDRPPSPRPGERSGTRAGEFSVDEPERPKRRGKPAADGQSGANQQHRHAGLAWRADLSDRLAGTRQCAHGRERHGTDCPARSAEFRVRHNHQTDFDSTGYNPALTPPVKPPPIVPPPIVPPPIIPPVGPAPTATYAMVTRGPFSTSTGMSPAPYLTGAFAGSGNFMVSPTTGTPFPILGYQSGGSNPDGTPATTSRQFQAGLSVTGKGPMQNATLFVMTSAISNAPNIGFTQAGGFTGVTMRNPAGWYGWQAAPCRRRRRRRRPTLCGP